MIFRDALRSLKESRSKAVFYWLTFYLTSALMFLFFNMAESATHGETEFYLTDNLADLTRFLTEGNMGNLMMVFVVIMCSVDLVYANDFYVKNKTKELAVRMISGATFTQLAAYLLIQTLLLLAVAIPLGIVTGLALIPLFNRILAAAGSELFIEVQSYGLLQYFSVTAFIVCLTTVLNMSFAYKSTAILMLNGNIESMNQSGRTFTSLRTKALDVIVNIIACVLFVLPVFLYYKGTSGMALYTVMGCFALEKVLTGVFLPFLSALIRKKRITDTPGALALGFVRKDIQVTRSTVYLFLVDTAVLVSMMFTRHNSPLERMLVMTSYIVISILQAMTIMFRLETELSMRRRDYRIMDQTGVSADMRQKTAGREILLYYVFVLAVALLYMGNIVIALVTGNGMTVQYGLFMLGAAVLPVVCAWILTNIYYRSVTV